MATLSESPAVPRGSHAVFLTTMLLVGAAILAFLLIDLALERLDAHESAVAAEDLAHQGDSLLAAGNASLAVDRYTAARALRRGNLAYAIALAQAQLADNRADDAERLLAEVLTVASSDGPANLTMARTLVRKGRVRDGIQYYHRAIYGQWGADSLARRKAARVELVDQLQKRGASADLLAELLPLEAMTDSSSDELRTLGHLYVRAGSPRRAQPLFRLLIRRNANDADAYLGLAEASLSLGNFRTAGEDVERSMRLSPSSPNAIALRSLVDSVAALDPTLEHTTTAERSLSSTALLAATLRLAEACAGADNTARSLMDSTRSEEAMKAAIGDRVERRTQLSRALWLALPQRCTAAPRAPQALSLVQAHLDR